MALMINETCTACDARGPECRDDAITAGNPTYVIDPLKCIECVGAKDAPQYRLVCPVSECIVTSPDFVDIPERRQTKYQAFHG